MFKKLNLEMAQGEDKEVPFLACATTGLRYKMLFGEELLGAITSIVGSLGSDALQKILGAAQDAAASGQEEINLATVDPETLRAFTMIAASGKLDTISKMAYIMNQQAEGADMRKLSVEGYLDWLEQFESLCFLTHALDFIGLYMANREGTSSLKKGPAPSTVK